MMENDLKKKNILVVDDEIDIRDMIRFELEMAGLSVTCASSGQEALEILQNKSFDLVISDIRMPNGDGVELLDKTKAQNATIPEVILLTGYSDLSIEDAYHKGVTSLIFKPFDPTYLMEIVQRALLSKNNQVEVARLERVPTDSKIHIRLSHIQDAILGRILNIGRGGMFIGSPGPYPKVGALTYFLLEFMEDGGVPIEGAAIVRWVRQDATGSLPSGYGVEFFGLDQGNRARILHLLQYTKSKIPFIPRE